MNRPRFPVDNEVEDPCRPPGEFWGPVRVKRHGVLLDAAPFSLADGTAQRPRRCPVCCTREVTGVGVVYGWPIFECGSCGVGFVWPQPKDNLLRAYYGPRYWDCYMGDSRPLYQRAAVREHILRRQAQLVARLLGGNTAARILDVGAGDGSMLRVLHDMGWNRALGLDMDEENVRRAQSLLGVPVVCGDFLSYEEAGWDAITFWAVIEHLTDPLAVVRHAVSLLSDGGLVVIMTGSNCSLAARVQRCFDMWMYPPEHLFFFGPRSLRVLLQRSGLSDVKCRLGYQNAAKEWMLLFLRLCHSLKVRLSPQRPNWRSTHSDLLVAYGRRRSPSGPGAGRLDAGC